MNERCMRILDMVREAGSVEVSTLAEALGVSAVTIRKDLAQLEKERLLRRQHGSAVQISSDDVAYRMAFDYGPKRRIAQRAAAMVQNGETVMIESGSTCALLAAELAENFISSLIGQTLSVLFEEAEGEYAIGWSGEYIRCYCKGGIIDEEMNVRVTAPFKDGVLCEITQ